MCFLCVLIFKWICFSILLCTASACTGDYDAYDEPQLWMKVTVQNKSKCITSKTVNENKTNRTITFRQRDTIKLECHRLTGNIPWNETSVRLQWKLGQFNETLMISDGILIGKYVIGNISATLNLDRYDNDLVAICLTNGTEQNNNFSVQFNYIGVNNVSDINEDIKNVTIKEGEMMPNKLAKSVIRYNAPNIKRDPKVILPKANIFDSITLEDSGTMYAAWAEESLENIVKTKWVVYVEPANPGDHMPIFLGIGGISCIVIAIFIVVCCKYCRKKKENSIENPYAEVYEVARVQQNQYEVNHPNPTPEGDYAQIQSQNDRVVYAQIDVRRVDQSTPMQDSEPYAKIIGVMKPNKNGKNVKMFKG